MGNRPLNINAQGAVPSHWIERAERQRELFESAAATGWFIYCAVPLLGTCVKKADRIRRLGQTSILATYTVKIAVQAACHRFSQFG